MKTARARTSPHRHKAFRNILAMTAAALAVALIARTATCNKRTKPPIRRTPPPEPPTDNERKGRITIVTKPGRSKA